jgi:hypothetical protein
MITSAVAGNPDTGGAIVRLATAHPIVGDTQFLVVLVDFTVVLAIEEGMFIPIGESVTEAVPGPLYPPYWQQGWGHIPPWEKAVAALMAPLFAELRDVAETTGLRIEPCWCERDGEGQKNKKRRVKAEAVIPAARQEPVCPPH